MTLLPVATLLAPRSVAVVGASPREDAVGFRIIRNLRRLRYPGALFPVNPRYGEVAGLPYYPSLSALPEVVDATFIAVPSTQGPALVEEAGKAGIRAVIVNASGYADGGPDGRALEERLQAAANAHGVALCGPNNMGFINVHGRTALWTATRMPELAPGPVAIISQSGSIAIALSQDERKVGLAYVITTGNEAVLTVADYLVEVVRDDRVRVVLLFLETLRNPAGFAEAAAAARARNKPVIALKVGRSEGGRAAVAAHTGALAGTDEVYDAFFRRHGIIRVRDLDEMVEAATLFSSYPVPARSRDVVVITLSGGEAALAADLGAESGLRFPDLSPPTLERLRSAFPPFATPRNPVDAWGLGWDPARFRQILAALLDDTGIATVAFAVDVTASGGGDATMVTQMAEMCLEMSRATDKRLVFFNNAVGCGPNPEIAKILGAASIPYLAGMRTSLAVLGYWTRYGAYLSEPEPRATAPLSAERWRTAARDLATLDEVARFRLLHDAGVPMVECAAVTTPDEAVAAAGRLGYPVVLKGGGAAVAHKTERGLVRLGLDGPEAVRDAFVDVTARARAEARDVPGIVVQPMLGPGIELIVGVRNDDGFGSLTVVGLGGVYVELLREVAIRLGPVSAAAAAAMLRETRAGALLEGFRGQGPFDLEAAAEAIAALSAFGAAIRGTLAAVEVNPLIVLPRGRGARGVDVLLALVARGAASASAT